VLERINQKLILIVLDPLLDYKSNENICNNNGRVLKENERYNETQFTISSPLVEYIYIFLASFFLISPYV
jgi:hypothetical protein